MALKNFSGAVAVISGGARGIGLATARALRTRGAHVVLADINTPGLLQAKERIYQHSPKRQPGLPNNRQHMGDRSETVETIARLRLLWPR